MKVTYNYSELRKRETKIYSISGSVISQSGISTRYALIFAICAIFYFGIGWLICLYKGSNLFIPFDKNMNFNPNFFMVFLVLTIATSLFFHLTKIQNYTISEYIFAYFKPKKILNIHEEKIKKINYKSKTYIENIER